MTSKQKVNVAVIGVGSLTKALVEGVSFYVKNQDESRGLQHPLIGGYKVSDINFVCAFDVDERKVGKKLSEAVSLGANITRQITEPIDYNALVYRGPTMDGLIEEVRTKLVEESNKGSENVAQILQDTNADVIVNLVPSGSDEATYFYAEEALKAGCSFINCIPTPLATIPEWQEKFLEKGLVLLGDDSKSQLGATMLNRILLQALKMRGIRVTKMEQENKGGNADHFNLKYRSKHKEKSKSKSLKQFLDSDDCDPLVTFVYTDHPSGSKIVTLNIEGEIFGRTPIRITSTIDDEISINGAGSVVDAIRVAQVLVDRDLQEKAGEISAFLMKTPPVSIYDEEARKVFDATIQ